MACFEQCNARSDILRSAVAIDESVHTFAAARPMMAREVKLA
ncbi:hypothetical protein STRNTR1_3779 [Stenotrophomonas maltophilia]|nr:hypothetical protein STRNTR1_3779 [Stenotrophomonas maltophilia]